MSDDHSAPPGEAGEPVYFELPPDPEPMTQDQVDEANRRVAQHTADALAGRVPMAEVFTPHGIAALYFVPRTTRTANRSPERRSSRAAGRHAATSSRRKATAGKSTSSGDDGPGEPPLASAAELEALRSDVEQFKADVAGQSLRIAQEFRELRAADLDALDERLSLRSALFHLMDQDDALLKSDAALLKLVQALLRAFGTPDGGAG